MAKNGSGQANEQDLLQHLQHINAEADRLKAAVPPWKPKQEWRDTLAAAVLKFAETGNLAEFGSSLDKALTGLYAMARAFMKFGAEKKFFDGAMTRELRYHRMGHEDVDVDLVHRWVNALEAFSSFVAPGGDFDIDEAATRYRVCQKLVKEIPNEQKRIWRSREEKQKTELLEQRKRERAERAEKDRVARETADAVNAVQRERDKARRIELLKGIGYGHVVAEIKVEVPPPAPATAQATNLDMALPVVPDGAPELDSQTLDAIARVDEIAAGDPETSAMIRESLAEADQEERAEQTTVEVAVPSNGGGNGSTGTIAITAKDKKAGTRRGKKARRAVEQTADPGNGSGSTEHDLVAATN